MRLRGPAEAGQYDAQEHHAGQHQGEALRRERGHEQRSRDGARHPADQRPAGAPQIDVLPLGHRHEEGEHARLNDQRSRYEGRVDDGDHRRGEHPHAEADGRLQTGGDHHRDRDDQIAGERHRPSPPAATRPEVSSSGWKQAAVCPGSRASTAGSGAAEAHASVAFQQRVRKRQPDGGESGEGNSP